MKIARFPLFVFLCLVLSARADVVTVSGVGASLPLAEKLGEAYAKVYPGDEVRVIKPPMGSAGALRALGSGGIDIAISGRPLKLEEQSQVGTATEWARTPLVMASHGGSLPGQAAGFTSAELAEIYAGRQLRWADGTPIRLVLRSSFESDTLLLRTLSPAMDQAMNEALVRKGMVIAENDLETLELLEKTPGSLGPVTLGLLRVRGSGLRVLALDGVLPAAQSLNEGRYHLSKPFLLVFAKTPTAAARRFGDFLRSDKVRTLLKSYEFIPAH